jgi:hypothetical protein
MLSGNAFITCGTGQILGRDHFSITLRHSESSGPLPDSHTSSPDFRWLCTVLTISAVSSTMLPEKSTTPEAKPTAVPLSTDFCADDADVVIRVADTLDFRVHKLMLSLVSPFFRTMFTVPQPPTNTPDTLPHVDVHESVETWENILRFIYRVPNPAIDDLQDLESLLLAATKYEMQSIIDAYKMNFEDRRFIQRDPLHLYAIACRCGLDDQAKYVARNAELLVVIKRTPDDLSGLTMASYHRLITFLVERDSELKPALERRWTSFISYCLELRENIYEKTKETLEKPCIRTEEVYLMALKARAGKPKGACGYSLCTLGAQGIREFIDNMLKERERACNKFMW